MQGPIRSSSKIRGILAGLILLEVALLVFALNPTMTHSGEIRAAHNRFIHDQTEENRKRINETVTAVLGKEHAWKEFALTISLANALLIEFFWQRLRKEASPKTREVSHQA